MLRSDERDVFDSERSVKEDARASQVKGGEAKAEEGMKLLTKHKLVLASASPRRAEILRAVGWQFDVVAADVDESSRAGEAPSAYVERLAETKAAAVAARIAASDMAARIVLGADTTVVVDGEILGKPRDAEDAQGMLTCLQNRWHEVLTGVALLSVEGAETRRAIVAHELTRVRFGAMSASEIAAYVATGEPMDKAGAYAVQGGAALFIERIEGDYWNVVGLPVRLVYRLANNI